MTNERIKEEFEKYLDGEIDTNATMFGYHYETKRKGSRAGYKNMAQGFCAGFSSAERLAKIEVLEKVIAICNETHKPDRLVIHEMLSELKAGR